MLSAALVATDRSLLGDIALLDSVSAWEMIATSPRYDMSTYYSYVFGALHHHDLPDMVAAAVYTSSSRVLVAQPLDAHRRPLTADRAAQVYGLGRSANASRLSLETDQSAHELTAALLAWLARAQ